MCCHERGAQLHLYVGRHLQCMAPLLFVRFPLASLCMVWQFKGRLGVASRRQALCRPLVQPPQDAPPVAQLPYTLPALSDLNLVQTH